MKSYKIKGKGLKEEVAGLTAFGLGTGLGAKVVSQAGGDAGGLTALSGFMPVAGTLTGTKMTLDMLNDIQKPFMKKGRR